MMGVSRVVFAAIVSMLMACASAVSAHEVRPAVADIALSETRAEITIRLTLEPLVVGMNLNGLDDTDFSPQAEAFDTLRALPPADLEAAFRARWAAIAETITLRAGDTAPRLELGAVTITPEPDVELPRDAQITLSALLPDDNTAVVFGWAAENGPLVVRQGSGDSAYTGYLTAGALSDPLPRSSVAARGTLQSLWAYTLIGFEHIIPKGLDHILFVLGLFFFSLALRPLVIQVTTFTVAHSVTLALATLGIVTVPASIVEPLIAASIVYIAAENVIGGAISWRRTAVIFGFGLLHGLGFASVLGDIGLDPASFVTGLVGFNIGVEAGQLAVIAFAFALLGLPFGKRDWYRPYIAIPASILIGAVGAYWTVERVFF